MFVKKTILGGGGLGDAAMIFAKLSKLEISLNELELTHVEVPDILLLTIKEFYNTQNINSNVIQIPDWSWKELNKDLYEIVLDTSAYGVEEDHIEINPFPKFNIIETNYVGFDILISPIAGRNSERNFNPLEIIKIVNKHKYLKVGLIGKSSNSEHFDNVGATNLINKTTINETLDIISKSNVVISPSGFISIISGMMGKIVYTKDNRIDIQKRYYHKSWNNKFINEISEIIL